MKHLVRLFTICLLAALAVACKDAKSSGEQQQPDLIDASTKYNDPASAKQMLARIDSAEQAGTKSEYLCNAYRTHIYFDMRQYRMAQYYGDKALKDNHLYAEDSHQYYEVVLHLISCALDNGDYKKALNYATSGLEKARSDKGDEALLYQAKLLSKIGQSQMRLNRLEEGFKSSEESFQLFKKTLKNNRSFENNYKWFSMVGEAIQHFNVCNRELSDKWLPRLDETYEAVKHSEDVPATMADYCLSKLNITKAETSVILGKKAEAQDFFKKYLQTDIARSGNDWMSTMGYYLYLKDTENTYKNYARWDSMCIAEHAPFNKEWQQILADMFVMELGMNKKETALQTAQRIITNLSTVDSITRSDDAAQLAVIYETQEKEAKIAEQEATLSHQRLIASLVAFVLMVAFFCIFIYFRHRSAKRMAEVQAAKERIESELRVARTIQMGMVPHKFPQRADLDLYASMSPAREVGGDLYSYLLEGNRLYFCIGDVSGKGVPASLFMAQATRLFHALAKQAMMPTQIATRLNAELATDNEQGMFITMFIGLVDLQSGHLWFCNAGHNPPVLGGDAQHGSFIDIETNAPIGLWPELEYVGEEIDTIKGKPLFIYTDGLNEAENQQQEQFGDERLLELLRDTQFKSARQVIEQLQSAVEQHRQGAEPNDDMTMMCLKVKEET